MLKAPKSIIFMGINCSGKTTLSKKLASYFDCSARTIYRNMTQELKKEKELLNSQL